MDIEQERLQIGEFAQLVGLSIPQLRRYDRLKLLAPKGRSGSGYRYYNSGQTGAGRVIALLRSMDMPIADIRRVLHGLDDTERQQLFSDHRARLEARLEEVQGLLKAVDLLSKKESNTMNVPTELSSWLHYMPHLPVTNIDKSVAYYEEALGFRLAWQTTDRKLTALASGPVELLLLVPGLGVDSPQSQSAYVYVENPDVLCAEYEQAGAIIVEGVGTRSYGMRDFTVEDPDGHRFSLGRADDYRYYSSDQVDTARLIGLLRGSAMGLSEIGQLVEATRVDPGSPIDLLSRFLDDLEAQHSNRRVLIRHVHSILREKDYDMFPIQTRHVESQRVMSIQRRLHASETDAFVAEAKAVFASHLGHSEPIGPFIVVFHGIVDHESDGPIEAILGCPDHIGPTDVVGVRTEPAHDEAYTTITKAQWAFPAILAAYDAVACSTQVMARPDSRLSCREVYLAEPDDIEDDEVICDIAFPLA